MPRPGEIEKPRIAASAVTRNVEVFVLLEDVLDFDSESKRLEKELAKLEKEFGFTQKKLSNEDFLKKAPADVIENEREKGTRLREKLEKLRHQYDKIKILRDSAAVRNEPWTEPTFCSGWPFRKTSAMAM